MDKDRFIEFEEKLKAICNEYEIDIDDVISYFAYKLKCKRHGNPQFSLRDDSVNQFPIR